MRPKNVVVNIWRAKLNGWFGARNRFSIAFIIKSMLDQDKTLVFVSIGQVTHTHSYTTKRVKKREKMNYFYDNLFVCCLVLSHIFTANPININILFIYFHFFLLFMRSKSFEFRSLVESFFVDRCNRVSFFCVGMNNNLRRSTHRFVFTSNEAILIIRFLRNRNS